MTEHEGSEYDVVTLKVNKGTLSIVCALVAFVFGLLLDELPFVLPYTLRRYLGVAMIGSLAIAALGIVLGILGARRPEGRTLARLGIVACSVVLFLEALFVLAFELILGR